MEEEQEVVEEEEDKMVGVVKKGPERCIGQLGHH